MEKTFTAVMPITPRPELVFTRGEGSWLEERKGRRLLDFVQGWAVNSLVHAPWPKVPRFMPALTVSKAEDDEMRARPDAAMVAVQQGEQNDAYTE